MRWAELIETHPPRSVMGFLKRAGRGINRYGMIGDGDRVLLSISGGKDSLAMALALRMRLRFVPITYALEAVMIDWREHPHTPESLTEIRRFFDALEIPFTVIEADMRPDSFGGRFDCYRCGRNRRRILFDYVRQWPGRPLIATGHHLDDLVQTTLMNMVIHGTFATMNPVQSFFDDALRVIRPLCEVRESTIRGVTEACALPVSSIDCPFREKNIRSRVAPIVEDLARIHPNAREQIFASLHHIDADYLPASCEPPVDDVHSEVT
ncbi:MAG: tRNA lysidine(34) synthetase [Alkalispirochaeta sp.]